jgi:uncharacterized membrane protein
MSKNYLTGPALLSALVMTASLASAAQAAEMHKPSQDKCFGICEQMNGSLTPIKGTNPKMKG